MANTWPNSIFKKNFFLPKMPEIFRKSSFFSLDLFSIFLVFHKQPFPIFFKDFRNSRLSCRIYNSLQDKISFRKLKLTVNYNVVYFCCWTRKCRTFDNLPIFFVVIADYFKILADSGLIYSAFTVTWLMTFLQTFNFHCFRWLKEKNST